MGGISVAMLSAGMVAVVVGMAVAWRSGRSIRRARRLEQNGMTRQGIVEAVSTKGRYNTYWEVKVALDGESFVETMATIEATRTGLQPGVAVAVQVLPGRPLQGRVARPVANVNHGRLGAGVAAIIATLGLIAAIVS